jgi:FxsC-like protein
VSFHVLAPAVGRLPPGRNRNQYGESSLDWNPFVGEAPETLGLRMAEMARLLGYEPTLVALDDDEIELPGNDQPTGPAILLVDPWALEHPKWRDRLHDFDRQDSPWVSVLVAWDLDEAQTAGARHRLLEQLNTTLESRFRHRRPGLHLDANVTSGLRDLGRALPTVLQESTRRYLRWISERQAP